MAPRSAYSPLRLKAEDASDLQAISACLQDAVAKIGDFTWLPDQRRFAFVANRFVWETALDRTRGPFERVRAGAHFDDVRTVQRLNLRSEPKDAILELLAVRFEPGQDGTGVVMLDFSGGGAIRLDVEAINARLMDISAPWRTRSKPQHAE